MDVMFDMFDISQKNMYFDNFLRSLEHINRLAVGCKVYNAISTIFAM